MPHTCSCIELTGGERTEEWGLGTRDIQRQRKKLLLREITNGSPRPHVMNRSFCLSQSFKNLSLLSTNRKSEDFMSYSAFTVSLESLWSQVPSQQQPSGAEWQVFPVGGSPVFHFPTVPTALLGFLTLACLTPVSSSWPCDLCPGGRGAQGLSCRACDKVPALYQQASAMALREAEARGRPWRWKPWLCPLRDRTCHKRCQPQNMEGVRRCATPHAPGYFLTFNLNECSPQKARAGRFKCMHCSGPE